MLSGDRATHGLPPGVTWTWWAFPEGWPALTLDPDTFTGAGEPLGRPGDLWWFTTAELHATQPGTPPTWIDWLADRAAARFLGPLALAFNWLGLIPLVWTVPDRSRPMTAAYQPHFRLAFGGSLYAVEQWVCRLNVTSSSTLMTDEEADTALPDLVTAVSAFVTSGSSLLSTQTALEFVKFNRITPTGHYATPTSPRTSLIDPAANGSGSATLPPQVAVAVSLLTAISRGKAHRGRIFLPCLVGEVDSHGLIGTSGMTNLGPACHTLIAAINAALPEPNAVSVLASTGEAQHVTGLAIGKVYDTQRRRRRSLKEDPYDLSALDL